jgi:SAM-dependent methyltransferase
MQPTTVEISPTRSQKHRDTCLICSYQVHPDQPAPESAIFPCNIRAFLGEKFQVWRCPTCRSIHTADIVNLDDYYAQYPFAKASLSWFVEILYNNAYKRLQQHGFSRQHSLLDYGCGANGTFIQYLQAKGFNRSYGYDPYADATGFGNTAVLEQGPFDFIVIQDVLEHVEDPRELLTTLNGWLAPGGYILIGTPNADHIDLNCPDQVNHYNAIHVPYHLHIFTRDSVELLGAEQGWQPMAYYDKGYEDTPWPGLNNRAWNVYQRQQDGSLDVLFEPIEFSKLWTSGEFLFNAFLGHFIGLKPSMAVVLYKPLT